MCVFEPFFLPQVFLRVSEQKKTLMSDLHFGGVAVIAALLIHRIG